MYKTLLQKKAKALRSLHIEAFSDFDSTRTKLFYQLQTGTVLRGTLRLKVYVTIKERGIFKQEL